MSWPKHVLVSIFQNFSKSELVELLLVNKKWCYIAKIQILGFYRDLKRLHLQYNKLTVIPKELGQLVNLKRLFLENNELKEIPKELGRLVKLKWLRLDNNKLTEIPKELEKFL